MRADTVQYCSNRFCGLTRHLPCPGLIVYQMPMEIEQDVAEENSEVEKEENALTDCAS